MEQSNQSSVIISSMPVNELQGKRLIGLLLDTNPPKKFKQSICPPDWSRKIALYEALVRRAQIIQVWRLYRGKNIGEKFNRHHHHCSHHQMDDLCHLCSCSFSVNLVNSTSTTYLVCMLVRFIFQVQNKPSDDTEGHHKTFVTKVNTFNYIPNSNLHVFVFTFLLDLRPIIVLPCQS